MRFTVTHIMQKNEITFDGSFENVYTDFYHKVEALYKSPLVEDATKSLIARLQTDYFLKLTMFECVLNDKQVATEEEGKGGRPVLVLHRPSECGHGCRAEA
jgi:hypothetical protein